MSRTLHVRPSADDAPATITRGQRVGRPPVRRTGTRSAVIAAALVEYGGHVELLGARQRYARPPLVRTASGSVELAGR